MMKLKHLLAPTIAALVLAPTLAAADPTTPDEWYTEGQKQYTLQNFAKAVEAFKKGYELETKPSNKPAYLYNVAQSYRQANECRNAQFYYKRYIAEREADTTKPFKPEKRKEVDDRISELDECAKAEAAAAAKAAEVKPVVVDPVEKTDPKDKRVGVGPDGTPIDDDDDGITTSVDTGQARLISARVLAGGAKVTAGSIHIPVQASVAAIAGYPIAINEKLAIEVGAGFTYTPVPYGEMNRPTVTSTLFSAFANAGASYTVIPKLAVRGDLGVGGLFFSNVGDTIFTNGKPTTGTLGMFLVRAGVSAEYAVTPNIVVTVAPIAFSISPAKTGLREDISSIIRLDFMVGVGYRM